MHIIAYKPNSVIEDSKTLLSCPNVCLSLGGGAWRGTLWLGLVYYIQEHYTEDVLSKWCFCGSSSGACYALALAIGFPAAKLETLLCRAATKARTNILGVAFRVNTITGEIIKNMIAEIEEDELIRRLHGRFALSFTAMRKGSCVPIAYIASNFKSKHDLFNACVGSCNIPFFSSLTYCPQLGGMRAFDGGLTSDGCIPLLPARCIVYGRCFGKLPKPLPHGVSLDIQKSLFYRYICAKTPTSVIYIRNLAEKAKY